ncbi:hypothetical protein HYX14_01760 [Candidatus Woesearchaeota archaeon]|nr:hypothetical protein [Candidatus Woesearchaeota archaeon]
MSNVYISNQRILDAIHYHRFGAVVEVTNRVTSKSKRQEKKRQVVRGKDLLQRAVGDSTQIIGGLALIQYTQAEIKELDFMLRMADYNPRLLKGSISRLLETERHLNSENFSYLSALMAEADGKDDTFIRTKLNPRQKGPYDNRLAQVKGSVLEFYVRELFAESLPENTVFALGTRMSDNSHKVCPDLIVAASSTEFRRGLENLVHNYTGQQRITVAYGKKFNSA